MTASSSAGLCPVIHTGTWLGSTPHTGWLPFRISLPHSHSTVSWDHLPNKPAMPQSLSQGLLLANPLSPPTHHVLGTMFLEAHEEQTGLSRGRRRLQLSGKKMLKAPGVFRKKVEGTGAQWQCTWSQLGKHAVEGEEEEALQCKGWQMPQPEVESWGVELGALSC